MVKCFVNSMVWKQTPTMLCADFTICFRFSWSETFRFPYSSDTATHDVLYSLPVERTEVLNSQDCRRKPRLFWDFCLKCR